MMGCYLLAFSIELDVDKVVEVFDELEVGQGHDQFGAWAFHVLLSLLWLLLVTTPSRLL